MTVKSKSFCKKEWERKKWKTFMSNLSTCIIAVFQKVVRICSFLYDIWESCLLGSCKNFLVNVSVSYFPICKTEIVKLVLSGWADQMERTSGQGPSFIREEYHTGKVIKKYPSKLFLIENFVFDRGYGLTNQLLYIVEKIVFHLPNIPWRHSSVVTWCEIG